MAAMERAPLRNARWLVTSSTFSEPMYTTRPSRKDARCWAPVLSIVVNLVQDASAAGSEWPMAHPRRPAGVSGRKGLLAALALRIIADHEVALNDIDLFPMVVDEGLGGKR